MESFSEIYGLNKLFEDETIVELVRILNSKTDEINVSSCLEEASLDVDCNEVYSNIFISDADTAHNKDFLKTISVTHILNAAEGDTIGMVNTNADYYTNSGMKYLGFRLIDLPITPIFRVFHRAADFIEEGINSGGKVLVHCLMGISRSSTCVIAYLMIKKHLSVQDAVRQVKKYRDIRPNNGFLRQLLELNRQLQSNT